MMNNFIQYPDLENYITNIELRIFLRIYGTRMTQIILLEQELRL
jgi:hypothetical protein